MRGLFISACNGCALGIDDMDDCCDGYDGNDG